MNKNINELIKSLNNFRGEYTIQKPFMGKEIKVSFENQYIAGAVVKTSNRSGGETIVQGKMWSIIVNVKKKFEQIENFRKLKNSLLKIGSDIKVTADRSNTMSHGIRIYNMSENPTAEIITDILNYIFIDNESELVRSWFISCNEWFIIDIAFENEPKLEWHQNSFLQGMKPGDIVYIYKTKPEAEIKYKGIVTKTKIKQSDLEIDDSRYVMEGGGKNYNETDLFFEFEFYNAVPKTKITLEILRNWGLVSAQTKELSGAIAQKIDSIFVLDLLDVDDNEVQEDIQQAEPATLQQAKTSSDRELKIAGNRNSEAVVKESKYAKYVLDKMGYVCQIDSSHETFSTDHKTQYMEGHHLIPCTVTNAKKFKAHFGKNIDCVENIVCLCPTCHRAVHLGSWEVKERLIKQVYLQQNEKLKQIGIIITENELLELYKKRKIDS